MQKYIENSPDLHTKYDINSIKFGINRRTGQLFVVYQYTVYKLRHQIQLIIYNLNTFQTQKTCTFQTGGNVNFYLHRLMANNIDIPLQNRLTFHVINYWIRRIDGKCQNIIPNDLFDIIYHYYSFCTKNMII